MFSFRSLSLAIVCLALPFIQVSTAAAQMIKPDAILATQLRKDDDLLLRAVHTADRAVWQRFAAPDFFYLDEEGSVLHLAEFLQQLEPLTSRPLQIQTYSLTRAGNTAIVIHEDVDEHAVRYIFTETWQELDGIWKLRALSILNVLSDPPSMQLSQNQIDELVGSYRSGSVTYTVRRVGNRIFERREGRPETEDKAETRDVLFSPGIPRVRKIFLRDDAGTVTGFVVRYESSDTLWTKVD